MYQVFHKFFFKTEKLVFTFYLTYLHKLRKEMQKETLTFKKLVVSRNNSGKSEKRSEIRIRPCQGNWSKYG